MAAVGVAMSRDRWQQNAVACSRCAAEFRTSIATLLTHHCRLCGRTFCGSCADKKLALAATEGGVVVSSERACRGCYELHVGRAAAVAAEPVRRASTLPSGAPWCAQFPLSHSTSHAKLRSPCCTGGWRGCSKTLAIQRQVSICLPLSLSPFLSASVCLSSLHIHWPEQVSTSSTSR